MEDVDERRGSETPYVSLYWQNDPKKTAFYVEPVSLTSYDVKY